MRHSSIVVLDNFIRNCWYGQGKFGLSAGLQASANMKKKRDSSGKVKGQASLFPNGQYVIRNNHVQD